VDNPLFLDAVASYSHCTIACQTFTDARELKAEKLNSAIGKRHRQPARAGKRSDHCACGTLGRL